MNQINQMEYEKRHDIIGKVSFIISLVGLILFVVSIILAFFIPQIMVFLIYPAQILITLGLLLGAISYFGPFKNKFGLVGFIISLVTTCILPIITILTFSIYSYSSGLLF